MHWYPAVYDFVRTIPSGKVLSYGDVALALGNPRGARMVGWALRALPADTDVPWQRVVNRQGVVSIINPKTPPSTQAERLREEGITVIEDTGALRIPDPPWWLTHRHKKSGNRHNNS